MPSIQAFCTGRLLSLIGILVWMVEDVQPYQEKTNQRPLLLLIREFPNPILYFNESVAFRIQEYIEIDPEYDLEFMTCNSTDESGKEEPIVVSFGYDLYYKSLNLYVDIRPNNKTVPGDYMEPQTASKPFKCFVIDEDFQPITKDEMNLSLKVTLLNPSSSHYLRGKESKTQVWNVKTRSEFKVPLDWSWVYTNSQDFDLDHFGSGRIREYPSQILTLKPITFGEYSHEMLRKEPFFASVYLKEREIIKFVILHRHAVVLSSRALKDMANIFEKVLIVSVFRIDMPDKVLEDNTAAMNYPHWGELVLNSQILITQSVELIKLCNTRAMVYGYSSYDLKDFSFILIDTESNFDLESFYLEGINVTNCHSLSRSPIYSDQYIVDCLEYNQTENTVTGWVSFTLSFRPFVVRVRARQDLRLIELKPWFKNKTSPSKVGFTVMGLKTDQSSRVEYTISIMIHEPSTHVTIVGTFTTTLSSTASPEELTLTPVSFASQPGKYSDFCMIDAKNLFWINSNSIVSGSIPGETVVYFRFNDSLIFDESRFYCLKNKKALLV